MVIQTDGYENASHEFSSSKIKEMIKHQQEKHDWQFMFVGANQDACLSATRDLGISVNTVAFYNSDNTRGMINTVSKKLFAARNAVDEDAYMAAVNYSAAERDELAKSVN